MSKRNSFNNRGYYQSCSRRHLY